MPWGVNYKKNKDVLKAHKVSFENEWFIQKTEKCGRFFSGMIFDPTEGSRMGTRQRRRYSCLSIL